MAKKTGRPLAGRAAVVTGGAVRVGAAVCTRLASLGCAVAVHHNRSGAAATRLAGRLAATGVPSEAVQADLADEASRAGLFDAVADTIGQRADILINNASSFPKATVDDLDWPGLQEALLVNAWAPFELTMALARQLPRGRSGHVVNFLDARIVDEDRGHVGYHFAKRMLADMTRMCAVTLAPRLQVNAVAPGPTLAPPGTPDDEGDELMERLTAGLPLRRTSTPDGLADAVAYLLQAEAVTGQILFVDGGRHLGRQPASSRQASKPAQPSKRR